jgi:hypothetical protein
MHARTTTAAVAVLALLGLAGCSSGKDPAKAPTPTSTAVVTPTPTTSSVGGTTASAQAAASASIRRALGKAQLTTAQVKLVRQKETKAETSGLSVRTFIACGFSKVDGSDFARVDRLQSSWLSKGWASQDPTKAQVKVASEVVAYRPGGVAAALKSYAGAPKSCPKTKFDKGVTGVVKATKPPAGLPKGTVILGQAITYKNKVKTTGFIVVIPAGNVLGLLYVEGVASDPKAVLSTRTRLLAAYAKRVAAAGTSIGTLTATVAPA